MLTLHFMVERRREEVIHVSAVTGDGIDRLTQFVTAALDRRSNPVTVRIPPGDGRSIALVRSAGAVDEERFDDDGTMHVRLRLSAGALGLLRRQLGPGVTCEPSST
jgi:50S ribosomal subunit-associated GTPase HflX